jgi:SAM-dependent methyltransferase
MPKERKQTTAFTSVQDVGLFPSSARSDARLPILRKEAESDSSAFDRLYADAPMNDPWRSRAPQYQYQRQKYDALMRLLPERCYHRALDLGCGLGLLTECLGYQTEEVLGIDISDVALGCAAKRTRGLRNVRFRQGDIRSVDPDDIGRFDLIVIADTIYYLPPPIHEVSLKNLVSRLASLLTPNGVLLLVNHYYPLPNAEIRLTLRIHRAFQWSPMLALSAEYRRAFFLASVLAPEPSLSTSSWISPPVAGLGHSGICREGTAVAATGHSS